MQIEGMAQSITNALQPKQSQSTTQAGFGPSFLENMSKCVMRTDIVPRGNELGASGLHSNKLTKDWTQRYDFEEDSLDDIFEKIARIDDILKEKFSK